MRPLQPVSWAGEGASPWCSKRGWWFLSLQRWEDDWAKFEILQPNVKSLLSMLHIKQSIFFLLFITHSDIELCQSLIKSDFANKMAFDEQPWRNRWEYWQQSWEWGEGGSLWPSSSTRLDALAAAHVEPSGRWLITVFSKTPLCANWEMLQSVNNNINEFCAKCGCIKQKEIADQLIAKHHHQLQHLPVELHRSWQQSWANDSREKQ